MDKIIVQTVLLNCSTDKAFEMFTENMMLENWLTTKANVEPKNRWEVRIILGTRGSRE